MAIAREADISYFFEVGAQEKPNIRLFGSDLIGTGYGFDYDRQTVSRLLDHPLPPLELKASAQDLAVFERSLADSNRTLTACPASSHVYTGGWYYQGIEPTCLPWSFASGMKALGIRPKTQFTMDLLNFAIDIEKSKRGGMTYEELEEMSARQRYEEVQISSLPGLHKTTQPIRIVGKEYVSSHGEFATTISYIGSTSEINESKIGANAKLIKNILDTQAVLLAVMSNHIYLDKDVVGRHSVCVAGYQVQTNGEMDIQVIDSERGIIWMSLEHLTMSLSADNNARILYT